MMPHTTSTAPDAGAVKVVDIPDTVVSTATDRVISLAKTKLASVGPVGPVAPVAPVAPVGPVGPMGPIGPVAPVGPVGPVAPLASSAKSRSVVSVEPNALPVLLAA